MIKLKSLCVSFLRVGLFSTVVYLSLFITITLIIFVLFDFKLDFSLYWGTILTYMMGTVCASSFFYMNKYAKTTIRLEVENGKDLHDPVLKILNVMKFKIVYDELNIVKARPNLNERFLAKLIVVTISNKEMTLTGSKVHVEEIRNMVTLTL